MSFPSEVFRARDKQLVIPSFMVHQMEFKFSNNHGSESEPANTESLVQQLQYQQQQEQIHQHQQLMMNLDPNQVNSSILQNHIAEVDSNISNEENVSLEIPFL